MEFPILLKTVCLLLKMGGLPTKIFGKGVGAGFADKCGHKTINNISVAFSLFQK